MDVEFVRRPDGSEAVILSRADYEDLLKERDARRHAEAMARIRDGTLEVLGSDEVDQVLATPRPLGFWRRKRGLTQDALARAVGISQNHLSQIENGRRRGEVTLYRRLAETLRVPLELLLPNMTKR